MTGVRRVRVESALRLSAVLAVAVAGWFGAAPHVVAAATAAPATAVTTVTTTTTPARPPEPPKAPKPPPPRPPAARLVGTWANDQSGGTQVAGGYELWSDGAVVALKGAIYYGDAVGTEQDDFVGMVSDYWSTGYWLVTSTGRVYSFGAVCKDQALVGPQHPPTAGVVGAIDLKETDAEGFNMVTVTGATYAFQCQ